MNNLASVAAIMALLMLAGPIRAQSADPTCGDMVIFPAAIDFETRTPAPPLPGASAEPSSATASRQLLGLNLPGARFRAGTGLWKLLCRADGPCPLAASRLAITGAIHPIYESAPVTSQVLSWPVAEGTPDRQRPGDVATNRLWVSRRPVDLSQPIMI